MSGNYNLNEKAGKDYFEFTLDDIKYRMEYPTSKDVLQLNDVINENDDWQTKVSGLTSKINTTTDSDEKVSLQAQLEEVTEKAKVAQESFIDWCLKYVRSDETDPVGLKETLLNKNVKYMLAFVEMVKTELNG
jgi:hypothetical protein